MKKANSSRAYHYIRKRILTGEFAPGQNLAETALSASLGVSRTPVRDALRQLEADGLVAIQPRLGASVKPMDIGEYRDMCGLRLALECHAAGLAALHRTAEDLKEIGAAVATMRELTRKILEAEEEGMLMEQLRQEDIRFHLAVMTAGKNLLMKEILRLHLIDRIVSSPVTNSVAATSKQSELDARRTTAVKSHGLIWKAIEAKDARAAQEEMARHITNNLQMITVYERRTAVKPLTEDELRYNTL